MSSQCASCWSSGAGPPLQGTGSRAPGGLRGPPRGPTERKKRGPRGGRDPGQAVPGGGGGRRGGDVPASASDGCDGCESACAVSAREPPLVTRARARSMAATQARGRKAQGRAGEARGGAGPARRGAGGARGGGGGGVGDGLRGAKVSLSHSPYSFPATRSLSLSLSSAGGRAWRSGPRV